jgi:hypothetical protein
MNKLATFLLGALLVATPATHTSILNQTVQYPAHPGHQEVQYLEQARLIKDSSLREAVVADYNQKVSTEQLANRVFVAVAATYLTATFAFLSCTFADWYAKYKLRSLKLQAETDALHYKRNIMNTHNNAEVDVYKAEMKKWETAQVTAATPTTQAA